MAGDSRVAGWRNTTGEMNERGQGRLVGGLPFYEAYVYQEVLPEDYRS